MVGYLPSDVESGVPDFFCRPGAVYEMKCSSSGSSSSVDIYSNSTTSSDSTDDEDTCTYCQWSDPTVKVDTVDVEMAGSYLKSVDYYEQRAALDYSTSCELRTNSEVQVIGNLFNR